MNELWEGAAEHERQHKAHDEVGDATNDGKERNDRRDDETELLEEFGDGRNDVVCPHSEVIDAVVLVSAEGTLECSAPALKEDERHHSSETRSELEIEEGLSEESIIFDALEIIDEDDIREGRKEGVS